MGTSLLEDAFAHHVWATVRLADACLALRPEQLSAPVRRAFGSILETMRHVVGGDSFDLFVLDGGRTAYVDASSMGLPELRAAMEVNGRGWSALLAGQPDPKAMVREVDPDDGYQRDAPLGIRLAQALHHGSDHRSQVCSALTALGVEPPGISAFDFGVAEGRITEVFPPA